MQCCIDGCDRAAKARNLCARHYRSERYAGRIDSPPCAVATCERNSYAKGLCGYHYQQSRLPPTSARRCTDCSAQLERRPGPNGKGSWPKRCPACDRTFTLNRQRERYREAAGDAVCTEPGCRGVRAEGRRLCPDHLRCSVDGCPNLRLRGTLCPKHRKHARQARWRIEGRMCSVEGCDRLLNSAGLCSMHLHRLKRHGDVGSPQSSRSPKPIPGMNSQGYVWIQVGPGHRRPEHRVVAEQMLGRPLHPWENVHHRNGVRHDNRPENLEVWVTRQPLGQRPEDVAVWMATHYPDLVRAALAGETPHLM